MIAPTWKPDQIAKLRAMVAEGRCIYDISVAIGRSRSSVRNYCRDHALKAGRDMRGLWTAENDAQLRKLYAGKMPCKQVAVVMGRSERAICSRATRLGLTARRIAKAKKKAPKPVEKPKIVVKRGGDYPVSPAWSDIRDKALWETRGKYAAIAPFADREKMPLAHVVARYHRIRHAWIEV